MYIMYFHVDKKKIKKKKKLPIKKKKKKKSTTTPIWSRPMTRARLLFFLPKIILVIVDGTLAQYATYCTCTCTCTYTMHDMLNPFILHNYLERVDRVTPHVHLCTQVSQQQIWHEVCNQMRQVKSTKFQVIWCVFSIESPMELSCLITFLKTLVRTCMYNASTESFLTEQGPLDNKGNCWILKDFYILFSNNA